jgi:hypothetical protein
MQQKDIRKHYRRITPVVEALGDLDGAVTLGNDDFVGWYVKRDCRDATAIDEGFDQEARPATLAVDWDTIRGRIDRVLYAITSYKPKQALIDWEPCTWDSENKTTHWRTDKPMPEYRDIEAVALWGDIDLVDELKPQRGDLDADTRATVEETLAAYARAFGMLYGSEDAVFALDSVGGAYIMGAPAATRPIATHFDSDLDARQRVIEALVERSNEWLEGVQSFVEATVDGAEDVIDPDWVNNKNRAYKAPLSLHADHDAVVTPFDPSNPVYEMTPADAVTDDLIEETVSWAERLTDDEYESLAGNIVSALWPEYTADHDDWRVALEEWVQDERQRESGPDRRNVETDSDVVSKSSDHRITPNIDDVYDAIDNLDPFRVAEKTIVSSWTEDLSGKSDNSGSGKKAFLPIWGTRSDSGTANYIDEKGVWVDTGANDHGTPVEMALISEGNWSRGAIADGEDWSRGVTHLRNLGFDIPVWTPDATVVDDDEMPYWALREAALALGVCDEEDLIEDEDEGYLRFDSEMYNAALDAVAEVGLVHGREKVGSSWSSDSSESSNGSGLYDVTLADALEATHPEAEPCDTINLTPPDENPGTVQVKETSSGIELYDPSINAGYSYIALSWLAVNAGARSPMHPSGQFSDYELWAAWKLAKENSLVAWDDPVPLRARLHIAREHDLAPLGLIDAAEDDPKALPAAVYNRILHTIEEEYGLNPGLDDLDVDAKAERRAELLSTDDDAGGDAGDEDKSGEVKRMLATLDEMSE